MQPISIFALLLIIATEVSFAQTSKGSLLLGGDASLSFNKSDYQTSGTSRSYTASLNPVVGYFVVPNFCAGLSAPFSGTRYKAELASSPSYKSNGSSFAVGPFVRYYVPMNGFSILAEGAYTWGKQKSTFPQFDPVTGNVTDNTTSYSTAWNYRFGTGVSLFLGKNASVDVLLNYQHLSRESSTAQNIFLSIGFKAYLPSRKD